MEVSIPETAGADLLWPSGRGETRSSASVGLRKGETFRNGEHRASVESRETHLFLRLLNMNYDISGFYSLDGKTWTPFETSSYVNDGRRLSLYATGSGEVAYPNLRYHGLDYEAIGR